SPASGPTIVTPRMRSVWVSRRACMQPRRSPVVRVCSTAPMGTVATRTATPRRRAPGSSWAPQAMACAPSASCAARPRTTGARIDADNGRRPEGGHICMTLAWQFLAQRGYRPLRPGAAPTDAPQTWCLRELYRTHYGFAILDEATVQVLAPYAPIVEVGAGSGYWAYELRQAGVEVVATDPGTGRYHGLTRWVPWLPIQRLSGVQAVRQYPDHTLLIVWPDYGQRWVSKTLRAYRGETVLYVGEGKEGCTGDAAFHAVLAARFPDVRVHTI